MTKHEILKKYFGYDEFREGQEQLIDAIMEGKDVLGIMPTGAGKSLTYQIPALMLSGITLVISPLISLMKDQVQALNQAGVHAAYINSSLSEAQISKALQLATEGRYKIIYVAPERLETYGFMAFARSVDISMVTVDEAHCISQWGQDFRPSYVKIVAFTRQLSRRPILSAFTATATKVVKEDIIRVLGLIQPEVLITGFDRKNLFFGVKPIRRKDDYIASYVQEHVEESGIIYCATRKNVDKVYDKLMEAGIRVTKYHAGLSNTERQKNQEDFIYDTSLVMIATNAFGMGIDKSNVRYVIHYNMPQSLENYYQEAGRAGRDGEASQCILFYSPQDVMINRFLLESKEENGEFTPEEIKEIRERDEERLGSMVNYCTTTKCLREYILHYFGEKDSLVCGNCSNCQTEFIEEDRTEAAKKIVACIEEMRGRYGINVVAGTLAGENRAKLREYGVSSYEAYGSLKEMAEGDIKELMNQMLAEDLLSQTKDKYALLRLNANSQDILLGLRQVIMRKSMAPKEEPAKSSRKSASRKGKSTVLDAKGQELFDLLRNLRLEIARKQGVPPYLVFSDKTLVDMCGRLPHNREEMLNVSGVGEKKFQQYGMDFINKIQEFTGGR